MSRFAPAWSRQIRSGFGLGGALALLSVSLVGATVVATAEAQSSMPMLAADAPLTLRPTPETRRLAERVLRTLALRLDVPVAVGEDAPPVVLEAVPAGHVALALEEGGVLLVCAQHGRRPGGESPPPSSP